MKRLTVLFYAVGKEPTKAEIPHNLTEMQKLVGGFIEAVPLFDDFLVVCNEEGKIEDLPPNRPLAMLTKGQNVVTVDILHGDFFVCKAGQHDFASMTDEDIALFLQRTEE